MHEEEATRERLLEELERLRERLARLEDAGAAPRRTPTGMPGHEPVSSAVLENINDIVYSIAIEDDPFRGTVRFVSGQVERIIGYRPEEFLEDPELWFRIIHPDDVPALVKATRTILESRKPGVREYRLRHKRTGEYRWMEDRVVPQTDATGRLTGHLGVARDVTERKRAEQELSARVRQQAAVADLGQRALEGIPLSRLMDEAVRLVSQTLDVEFCKVLELLPDGKALLLRAGVGWKEGIVGQAVVGAETDSQAGYTLLSSEPVIVQDLATETRFVGPPLLRDHGVVSGVSVIIHGRERPFGILGAHTARRRTFTRDDIHFLQAVANVLADAIGRKRAEDALLETNQTLRTLIQALPLAIVVLDRHGNVRMWNPAAERIFGWKEKEVLGAPHPAVPREAREAFRALTERVFSGSVVTDQVLQHQRKDGSWIDVSLSAAPLRDATGKIVSLVGILADVTERRRMEEELLKASKLESLGVLAGGIAHDFNNIMTAVLGNISLAKTHADPVSEELLAALDEAEKASLRAKALTQQLLAFAKGGAPVKKVASMAACLKETTRFALRGSKVRCELDVPGDLWPVEMDEGQVGQVIHNLVINAQQAMPEGGTLRVRATNTVVEEGHGLPLKPGEYVAVSIRDQGPGIPEDHLQKIFDPFFTTKPRGSGLGLAMAYAILKNHDGHIAVESRVGSGSTFTLYLPASPDRARAAANPEGPEAGPPPGKARILLMDDEEIIRDVASRMLRFLGYAVTVARDGREALDLYREAREKGQPFDLVLMDLTIPGGMGGKEAVGKLLEMDPRAKVIVSSGYSNDPIMAEYRQYGFRGVVVKPYHMSELKKAVEDVLKGDA